MVISLDPLSGKPMYEQIEDSIRENLLKEEQKVDSPLPSVRQLSEDLNVSAITIKRVYADLEREGYVYTIAGKGTFVSHGSLSRLKEEKKQRLLEELNEAIGRLLASGVTKDEVLNVIKAQLL